MSDLGGQYGKRRKKAEEPEKRPAPKQVSAYLEADDWKRLRVLAMENDVTASTIISALMVRFMESSAEEQADVVAHAQRIARARAQNRVR